MDELVLVEIGVLPVGVLSHLAPFLAAATGRPCHVQTRAIEAGFAYNAARDQHDCRTLLLALEELAASESRTILGVIGVDIGSAIFAYVFGESRLGGRAAVISVERLRPEVYGLAPDPDLLLRRARRVALHEVGHLAGLLHCRGPDCVMRFSGVAEQLDQLADDFCDACRSQFVATIEREPTGSEAAERQPAGSEPTEREPAGSAPAGSEPALVREPTPGGCGIPLQEDRRGGLT